MSDPALESILDAIATAMATIDGTGSFETTVLAVNERPTQHATEVTDLTPSIDVLLRELAPNDRDGAPRNYFAGEVRRATIDVYGYLVLNTEDVDGVSKPQSPHKAWLPLARDVERIVKANRTWSSLAIITDFAGLVPEYGATDVAFTYSLRVEYSAPRA